MWEAARSSAPARAAAAPAIRAFAIRAPRGREFRLPWGAGAVEGTWSRERSEHSECPLPWGEDAAYSRQVRGPR